MTFQILTLQNTKRNISLYSKTRMSLSRSVHIFESKNGRSNNVRRFVNYLMGGAKKEGGGSKGGMLQKFHDDRRKELVATYLKYYQKAQVEMHFIVTNLAAYSANAQEFGNAELDHATSIFEIAKGTNRYTHNVQENTNTIRAQRSAVLNMMSGFAYEAFKKLCDRYPETAKTLPYIQETSQLKSLGFDVHYLEDIQRLHRMLTLPYATLEESDISPDRFKTDSEEDE